ncbi:MAG TPA: MHYT domain-containing protein [Gemmatimonadaceae bacterium]|nr:MHYT domain-containing protein [Gemmatimonadaceae bacterium]
MHGTYDSPLVALSVFIAILASYTALALTGRVTVTRGSARRAWLLGGSIAMGIGIWSMHFVAMLAFQLPIPIAYDVPRVALSLLAGIAASAFALVVASRPTVGVLQLLASAVLMGGGIGTMHYTGMAALRMPARLSYDLRFVALSGLIAFSASAVALWLFRLLRDASSTRRHQALQAGAAVLLGCAIAGLHYTAMMAVHFVPLSTAGYRVHGFVLATEGLAGAVVISALLILALTIVGSVVDHWVRVKLAGAEALRESEERYRSVVSQVREVIFRTDAAGRWLFLNPAWTGITGFSEAESLETTLFDYVHPDDRDAEMAAFRALAEGTERSSRREVRYLTRAGGVRWLEVHAGVTRDAAGTLLGTAGTLRDVTERRQAEEALRAARETAEAANRAKSEFLSRVSHELRTPLNAILGFGQLLEIEELSPENHESVQHILRGGRHLLDLINEVLDLTGIEAGRLRLSPESVSVSEVAREVLDLLRPLAAKREVTLRAHGAQGCASHVMADRQRLKQVLLNLLSNAIKYNVEGGSVVVTCTDVPVGRLRVTVQDTGPGIPADRMDRLFMPFERLGAEQTGVEGTGLGLALSRRLAEAMGGSLGAESTVGGGSTFWIELPLAESQVERWERLQGEIPAPAEARPADRTVKILYVEDNLANLALVQRILARRPELELIPAMQGELAVELARLHQPDLVLLDLHLPDISGEEVLRRLRQGPDTRALPVIVVSADATSEQPGRLLASGAQGYLTKPLDVRRFVSVVDEMLATGAAAA